MLSRRLPLALGCLLFMPGCGSDAPPVDPGWSTRDTTLLPPWQEGTDDCDETHTPVIMAHGFLAAGDTYANHTMRLVANGYCQDRIFAYDWNSIGGGDGPELLDVFVDEVLSLTGASQVDLFGHSAGGGVGYNYLEDAARAAKVRRYVHVGSGDQEAPAGPTGEVPTLNLYSANDRVVSANAGIPGATNVDLVDDDHYEVATSDASFAAIWAFLNDGVEPAVPSIVPQGAGEPLVVAGRAASLADNVPARGATVDVYDVDASTGARRRSGPLATFITDDQGYWGPMLVQPDTRYEFHVSPTVGDSVHYYRESFVRSNTKVYLRTLPIGGAALLLTGAVRRTEDQPTSVLFIANRGLQPGDTLTFDDVDLSGDEYTNRDETTIALFFFDDNDNDTSDQTPVALFSTFPFLAGLDYAPGADPSTSSVATFNGRSIAIPRWAASTEGVGIAVFE